MRRRDWLRAALALPLAAPLRRLTAADRGKVKITGIQIKPISRLSHTLIRIDTDAGVSGFGESGVNGDMARAWLGRYKPLLIGEDPLAIERHFHRMSTMMHPYMASIPALSGIDMALWDLAGRLTGYPVHTLLGGPFRERIPLFINSEPRDLLDRAIVSEWAAQIRAHPQGFRAVKVNTTAPIGKTMAVYSTALTVPELNKIRAGFENVRGALGTDFEIMAHCHNEYDLPSAIGVARAVEPISPKWLEDALPVPFSESWVSLKRESRVPLLTGEKLELPQGFYPFLKNQVVDFINPDIAFCGGLTGARKIATLAALYRIPVATHNVGGILLTMASVHFGASIHDFLITETRLGGQLNILSMAANPPLVERSAITLTHTPGLGVELSNDGVKAWQLPEDSDWVSLA
jgi:L-alanine-DL-glutamate epimerase-like enolase superfamily enzyme